MDMMSADELLSQALRYKAYWGDKGGITVSGGEPLLQMDFLLELFTKAKENGDSAWFVIDCVDKDSAEHLYLTYFFRFSTQE